MRKKLRTTAVKVWDSKNNSFWKYNPSLSVFNAFLFAAEFSCFKLINFPFDCFCFSNNNKNIL